MPRDLKRFTVKHLERVPEPLLIAHRIRLFTAIGCVAKGPERWPSVSWELKTFAKASKPITVASMSKGSGDGFALACRDRQAVIRGMAHEYNEWPEDAEPLDAAALRSFGKPLKDLVLRAGLIPERHGASSYWLIFDAREGRWTVADVCRTAVKKAVFERLDAVSNSARYAAGWYTESSGYLTLREADLAPWWDGDLPGSDFFEALAPKSDKFRSVNKKTQQDWMRLAAQVCRDPD